jgi:hypothetical protein
MYVREGIQAFESGIATPALEVGGVQMIRGKTEEAKVRAGKLDG